VPLGSAWPAGEEGRSLQLPQSRPAPEVCTSERQFRLEDSKFPCGGFVCIPGAGATGMQG